MATRKVSATVRSTSKSKAASKEVGLSSPWVTFQKEVYNLFEPDPTVHVDPTVTDEGDGVYSFTIYANHTKIAALKKIIKNEIKMGNIILKVYFEADDIDDEATDNDWKTAFADNPYFVEYQHSSAPGLEAMAYAVFDRKIITFFNDDLTDYCCNKHMIVADLVKDVVNPSQVYPCTLADGANDKKKK